MMQKLLYRPAAALVAAGMASACAPAARTSPEPVAPAVTVESPRSVQTTAEAIAQARADSARVPYTEGDVRFMTGMIPHHAQAIQMSLLAPDRTTTTSIRTLAARIINAQRDEIFQMQQWLADRRRPWPHVDETGAVHGGAHGEHGEHAGGHSHSAAMAAGMLSGEQMRQLAAARGTEFDRLFLTFMIQHHKGAVAMVRELLSGGDAAHNETVFRLAADINVDQTTEIARMERMLAELRPTPREN